MIKSFQLHKLYSHRNMLDACFYVTKVRDENNSYEVQWYRKDGFNFNVKDTIYVKSYDNWYLVNICKRL